MTISDRNITHFTWKFLQRMSEKYGGDVTCNELRVMNAAYKCTEGRGGCSNSRIAELTGIPRPTVTRAVGGLIVKGWLVERPDPNDGRRKIISLSPYALSRRQSDWSDCKKWLQE